MVEKVEDEDSPTHLSTWNNEGTASSQNSQANWGATTSSTMEKPKVRPITEEWPLADMNYLSDQP